MNMKAFSIIKMKQIIAIARQPNWICVILNLLAPCFLAYAQAQAPSRQRLPKVEQAMSTGIGQRQIPTEPIRYSWSEDGYLLYLGAPPFYHFPVSAAVPGDQVGTARNFLKEQANLFGVTSAAVDFSHLKTKFANNRHYVRFEQTYAGIPVFAAQMTVQVDAQNGIECVLSDIALNTKELDDGIVSLMPLISATEASARARNLFANQAFGAEIITTLPRLTFFVPSVLDEGGSIRLVWEMKVFSQNTPYVNEHILLNVHNGEIVRQYPLNIPALNRQIFDANNTTADPGTLVRSEGGMPSGIADADNVYTFLGDTYNFYSNEHGRDSVNGSGMTLSATVRVCDPNPNPPPQFICPTQVSAFWNSGNNRMYYGAGFATDDVTGHELTHGVTQFESNLVYANASGAMNESFSDVWGEFVDLGNGQGNDDADVRWLIGEDFGAFRNMSDPPAFNDPDRVGSPLYIPVVPNPNNGNDFGGVHTNSGVNNKLCFLLTDGDAFNGQIITGMGINRVADLYYEVNTNLLSSGANWTDLYNALTQAAVNLGWNSPDRNNLYRACAAVEITAPIQDIYVDGSSVCVPTGSQFCGAFFGPFSTVTQGVNAIFPGNLLFIRAGSYNEVVTFDKIMEIRAYDGIVTIGASSSIIGAANDVDSRSSNRK